MNDSYVQSIYNSLGKNAPDLILKNGKIFDVMSGLVKEGDITIKGQRIIGLYDDYSGCADKYTKIIDVKGKYLIPGLIEPHIHVESSMLSMTNFARTVIPHGTSTIVNDPHEIANVLGKNGIIQMMHEAEYCKLRCYFTAPSCVPALGNGFETSGAVLGIREIKSLLDNRMVIGLGEVMNYPGVILAFPDILSKINETYRVKGYKKSSVIVDGHCPGLTGKELSAYINGGIMADHECATGEELEEKLSKGMHVMVRNGSSARNMEPLLDHVIRKNIDTRRLMFCVDDKNPYELIKHGHIDYTLKQAAEIVKQSNGRLTMLDILRMATLNVADFFGFKYLGRLAIQARADITIVEDLVNFNVFASIINGKVRAIEGKNVDDCEDFPYHSYMLNTVKINKVFKKEDFQIIAKTGKNIRVIKINPGQLVTDEIIAKMLSVNGFIESDVKDDILKISIVQRHTGESGHFLGFVNGFGIKDGAVATTIGHDSHNIGVIGVSDRDMAFAVEEIKKMQGGIVVVKEGKTIASMELKIGGLQSLKQPNEIVDEKQKILEAYRALGGRLEDPIISMSFLQLPVIPHLKITDKSLVKITSNGPQKVSLFV